MKDELTPLERGKRYFSGERVDRLPYGLVGVETGCSLYGVNPKEVLHSAELAMLVQKQIVEEFGVDSVGFGPDLKGIAEALGTEVYYPEHSICYVKTPILNDYRQLEKLKELSIYSQGRLPMILETLQKLKETYGETHPVSNAIAGPLSTAAAIRGTEAMLKDMKRNEENLHELLAFTVETNLKWVKHVWDRCEIKVSISDPVASGSLISHQNFLKFEKPYLKKLCEGIEKITGKKPSLHICGKTRAIWEDLKEIGISGFLLDNCENLEDFKNTVGDKIAISGNIDPTNAMRFGIPRDI